MRFAWLALVLVGCDGPQTTYAGLNMDDFFAFDGQRTWEYVNDDPSISYHVIGTLDPNFESLEGGSQRAYTINYTIECFAEDPECVTNDPFRIRAIKMSSDLSFGTLIHSVDLVDSGMETFNPPIELTGGQGKVTDVWDTDSNGTHFASYFKQKADCDVPYTDEWTDCITLFVDADAAGDAADALVTEGGHPLYGEWVAVPGYNVIQFRWRDDAQPWRLLTQQWDGE